MPREGEREIKRTNDEDPLVSSHVQFVIETVVRGTEKGEERKKRVKNASKAEPRREPGRRELTPGGNH